jgi:hypothetical protein
MPVWAFVLSVYILLRSSAIGERIEGAAAELAGR